ncbi:hypothetical protein IKZ70_04110, partial [bacterium]|nr:hypothetical protein [bacterium]
ASQSSSKERIPTVSIMLLSSVTLNRSFAPTGRHSRNSGTDASAVSGIMVREKPAANFLLGNYAAESLIIAEAGASTGAIQIAGTAAISQIPFFIVACDYTLIGEELFAAGAYVSREPLLLGSLKGQDIAKLVIILIMIVAIILATVVSALLLKDGFVYGLSDFMNKIFDLKAFK